MTDSYMQDQAAALAEHLRLTDGKSGYVEATADGFVVYLRRKWPGKPLGELGRDAGGMERECRHAQGGQSLRRCVSQSFVI